MEHLNRYEADAYVIKSDEYVYIGKYYAENRVDLIEKIRSQANVWHSDTKSRIYIRLTDRERGVKEIRINRKY